jgi:hypothetical protein
LRYRKLSTDPGSTASSTTSKMGRSAKRTRALSSEWFGILQEKVLTKSVVFDNGGEGNELSDELKKEGDLVVGDRQEPCHSQPVKPVQNLLRRCMCHVKKWRGALAEAHANFQVLWSYLQPHFASILNELWGTRNEAQQSPITGRDQIIADLMASSSATLAEPFPLWRSS